MSLTPRTTMTKPIDTAGLKSLVHYAVDKASPWDLANHPETDTFDDIAGRRLTQLNIGSDDVVNLWLWINANVGKYNASQVGAVAANKAKTVQAVYDAILAASKK
jgi:hypothetical protein